MVSCGRMDRQLNRRTHIHEDAIDNFSQICENTSKSPYFILHTIIVYEAEEVRLLSFVTSALHVVSDQLYAPTDLPLVMILLYPMNKRMCGNQGLSGHSGRKIDYQLLSLNQTNHLVPFCINTCT